MTKEEIQKNSEHWYNKYKELENKIADIKANCDYVLEGKDLEIKQLGERCNQLLKDKGDLTGKNKQLELIILGNQEELENQAVAYETLKLHDQEEIGMLNSRIAELKQQIEKMKRHCNCKHRDYEGYCEVKRTYLMDLSYDGCDKWELED